MKVERDGLLYACMAMKCNGTFLCGACGRHTILDGENGCSRCGATLFVEEWPQSVDKNTGKA